MVKAYVLVHYCTQKEGIRLLCPALEYSQSRALAALTYQLDQVLENSIFLVSPVKYEVLV